MAVEENKEKVIESVADTKTEQPQQGTPVTAVTPEKSEKPAERMVSETPEAVEKTAAASAPEKPGKKGRKPYVSHQYMVLPVKSYFWTMILFCIPLLGPLACIIISLGGSRYRNKIHFARACFLMMLLQAAFLTGIYFLMQFAYDSAMNSIHQFLTNTGVGYPADFTALDEWVEKLQEVPQVHQYLQNLNQRLLP